MLRAHELSKKRSLQRKEGPLSCKQYVLVMKAMKKAIGKAETKTTKNEEKIFQIFNHC